MIVNTIGQKGNLSEGFVSKSLLNAAGDSIQDELTRKMKGSILNFGEVMATKAGNIWGCKAICHGVLPHWTPRTELSLRVYKF